MQVVSLNSSGFSGRSSQHFFAAPNIMLHLLIGVVLVKKIKNLKIKKSLDIVAIVLIKTRKKFWIKNFYQKCLVYCVKPFFCFI